MLAQPVSRRSFLAGAAAVLVAVKPRRPRRPPPVSAAPTFRLRASSLRGGAYLRGGL